MQLWQAVDVRNSGSGLGNSITTAFTRDASENSTLQIRLAQRSRFERALTAFSSSATTDHHSLQQNVKDHDQTTTNMLSVLMNLEQQEK